MSHPHQSMIDEFSHAIKQFVPTVPKEVEEKAQARLEEITKNTAMDEKAIQKIFYEIGVEEYPHRKAYNELTHSTAEKKMKEMVIEHVDEEVRGIIAPLLESGVSLDELVASDMFEEKLDGKQRYQVEDGILVAKDKLAETLKNAANDDAKAYEALVEKWTKHAQVIEDKIEELLQLAQGGTENQQAEIKAKAARFKEGFLVTEQDPELEHVEKEIEYWTDTFAEEE